MPAAHRELPGDRVRSHCGGIRATFSVVRCPPLPGIASGADSIYLWTWGFILPQARREGTPLCVRESSKRLLRCSVRSWQTLAGPITASIISRSVLFPPPGVPVKIIILCAAFPPSKSDPHQRWSKLMSSGSSALESSSLLNRIPMSAVRHRSWPGKDHTN